MSAATEVRVLGGRTVRRFFRSPPAFISALAFPLVLLFANLAVYGKLVSNLDAMPYVQRITPLIILATAGYGSAVTATGTFRDLQQGFADRIRALPVSRGAFLAGRVAGDFVRVILVALVVTLVAYLPGFRFSRGVAETVGFFGVVAAFGIMCTCVGVWRGVVGTSEETVQSSLSAPATLLVIMSSGLVPLRAFPGAMQPVVRVNPVSVGTEALIGLSHRGPIAEPVLQAAAWVALVGGFCLAGTLRRLAQA